MIFPDRILPFIEFAPIMKVEIGKTISTDKLFYTGGALLNDKPTVYNVLGTSIFFTDTLIKEDVATVDVFTVDYRIILNRLSFQGDIALYPNGEGLYSCLDSCGLSAINSLLAGTTTLFDYEEDKTPVVSECIHIKDKLPALNEANFTDFSSFDANLVELEQTAVRFASVDAIIARLEAYLGITSGTRGADSNAMVMIYGLPGIGKTAIIKSLVGKTKKRYRLEEVATPAINLLDLNGLGSDTFVESTSDSLKDINTKAKTTDIYVERPYTSEEDAVKYNLPKYTEEDAAKLYAKATVLDPAFNYAFCDFLFKCSDEYIEFCRAGVKKLKALQEEGKIRDEDKISVEEAIKKLEYYGKAPILFLDEFNMASDGVFNAMMTIFSDKTFGNMHFKKAKVIGASNEIIDPKNPQEAARISGKLFKTKPIKDPAHKRRIMIGYISPADFFPTWKRWALQTNGKGLYNLHPALWNVILKDRGGNHFFDVKYLKGNLGVKSDDDPGPQYHSLSNPRGWTMLSDILYRERSHKEDFPVATADAFAGTYSVKKNPKDNKTDISGGFITRLLGPNSLTWLQNDGVFNSYFNIVEHNKEEVSDLQQAVEDGWRYMQSTILLGEASTGKSARIKQLKDNNPDLDIISVDVSAAQPSELNGSLRKRSIYSDFDIEFAQKRLEAEANKLNLNVEGGFVTEVLKDVLSDLNNVEGYHLADEYTQRTPLAKLQKMINDIKKNPNKKCIIFFDELTRYTSFPVLGAVQLAITARKLYGCDIPADKFLIMAAGNVGKNFGGTTKDLYLPLITRLQVALPEGYTEAQVKEYINYMKTAKDDDGNPVYLKASVDFIQQLLDKGKAVNFLSKFEGQTKKNEKPVGMSSAAFETLNNFCKELAMFSPDYEAVFHNRKSFFDKVNANLSDADILKYVNSKAFEADYEYFRTSYAHSILYTISMVEHNYTETIDSLRSAKYIVLKKNLEELSSIPFSKLIVNNEKNERLQAYHIFRLSLVFEDIAKQEQLTYLKTEMGYAAKEAESYLALLTANVLNFSKLLNQDNLSNILRYFKLNYINEATKYTDLVNFFVSTDTEKGIFAYCSSEKSPKNEKITPKDFINFLSGVYYFLDADSAQAGSGGTAPFEEFLLKLLKHCKANFQEVSKIGLTSMVQLLTKAGDSIGDIQKKNLISLVPGDKKNPKNLDKFFATLEQLR